MPNSATAVVPFPTIEGSYWVQDSTGAPYVVRVFELHGKLRIESAGSPLVDTFFVHRRWCGPIDEPVF